MPAGIIQSSRSHDGCYTVDLFDCDFIEVEIFRQNFLVCENWHGKFGVWSSPLRNAPGWSEFRSGLFRNPYLQWQICNSIFSTVVILENGSRTPELPLVFFFGTTPKKREMLLKGAQWPISSEYGFFDQERNGYRHYRIPGFLCKIGRYNPGLRREGTFFLVSSMSSGPPQYSEC